MPNTTPFPSANETGAEAAKVKAEGDLGALQRDFAALREDVKAILGDAKKYASFQSKRGADKGRELADSATGQAGEARDAFEAKIRAHPIAAVGIALGAGFLIGALKR